LFFVYFYISCLTSRTLLTKRGVNKKNKCFEMLYPLCDLNSTHLTVIESEKMDQNRCDFLKKILRWNYPVCQPTYKAAHLKLCFILFFTKHICAKPIFGQIVHIFWSIFCPALIWKIYAMYSSIIDLYNRPFLYFDSSTSTSLLRPLYFDSRTSTSAKKFEVQVEVQFWSKKSLGKTVEVRSRS